MRSASKQIRELAFKSPIRALLDKPVDAFWTSLCFSLLFCGYPLVSFIPDFVAMRERQAAIVFRGFCFFLSLVIAVMEIRHTRRQGGQPFTLWVWVALFFWAAYLVRILTDELMRAGVGPMPLFDFLAYSYGISAATLFSMMMIRDPARLRHAPAICAVFGAIVCAAAAYFGMANYTVEMAGRLFANDRLNPILLGHSAVIMIVSAIWLLFQRPRSLASSASTSFRPGMSYWFMRALLTVTMVGFLILGSYALILSSSRSPVVALGLCLCLQVYWLRSRALFLGVLILIATGLIIQAGLVAQLLGAGLDAERMTSSVLVTDDYRMGGRFDLFAEAIYKFLASPIWGESLFNSGMSYPHNLLFEALMALGLIGGFLLSAMLVRAFGQTFAASRQSAIGQWLFMVFVHALVATMTSGAIFYDPMIWTTLGVGLGISLHPMRRQPRHLPVAPSLRHGRALATSRAS